jgi:hypothetical protein
MQPSAVRYGGLCAVAGGVLSAAALIAEPTFDGDLPAQLRGVAASSMSVATGLLGIVALLLVVSGALAIAASLAERPTGKAFTLFLRPLITIGGTVALIDVSIDLSAYHQMADQYVNAAPSDLPAALYSASAVGAVGAGLHGLWALLLLGVVPILVSVAIYLTRLYPVWLAVPALVGGLIEAVLGVIGLLPIYDLDISVLDLTGRLLAVVAVVAAGALLWMRPGRFADGSRGAAVADSM